MKAKFIRMIIGRKIDKWAESIQDPAVAGLVRKNTIVTGGCITSMLLNDEVNDFDVYFRDKPTALAVASYYVAQFLKNPPTKFKGEGKEVAIRVEDLPDRVKLIVKSAGIASEKGADNYEYFETLPTGMSEEATNAFVSQAMGNVEGLDEHVVDEITTDDAEDLPKYRPVFLSSNAITLSDKVQVVTRFFGEPAEIHGNYDFVHCTNYWTAWDRRLTLNPEALEATLCKDLRYVGSKYPICSVIRTRKFIKRGWNINAGQYLKMLMQVSELNLKDINVLEEQLVGVDAAYFTQLIEALREGGKTEVESSYVATILDRIF